jgi:hypothetical protein
MLDFENNIEIKTTLSMSEKPLIAVIRPSF